MNTENIHLRDYLNVVSKHRGMVLTIALVILGLTALVTFSATPQFRGTTQVMIEKATNNSLTDGSGYRSWDPEFYETQFQLIRSQQVARRVVELLDLENKIDSYLGSDQADESGLQAFKSWLVELKDSFFNAFDTTDEVILDSVPELSRLDEIAAMLSEDVQVSPVRNSRMVNISFVSPNPEFAALIANTVAKAYIETTLEMKMEATRRTLEWMTEKADLERAKLEKTEQEMQSYMRSNNLVTLENRVAVIPEKLSEISSELVRVQNKRQRLQALYGKVNRVAENPDAAESILGITNGETLQILRDQILKAEQYIRELSGKFGARHPTMIKAQGDLEILKTKKTQEVNRLIDSVKNEYELAVTEENNLRRQLEQTKAEAHNLNEKYIQYGAYKREMETNRQLYDALLLKMKEQNITGETQPVNLWIVEQARTPQAPFKPNKKKNLALGLILGLFSGVGLAFFVEYLDQSIKYPDETEKILGTPVLGMVSLFKEKKGQIEKIMLDDPRSVLAESYRSFRTSLMLSAANQPPRKVLITSPAAGAGKSTTSTNLAMTLAQSGKKVLLIDGDMRKPRLHKIFDLKSKQGLSSYLAGSSNGEILQRTAQANLTLLPAGPIPPNPSELLLSGRMHALVEKLSQDYDMIICDSPPLQSVTDARILSALFDGTVVVVKAKQTTFDQAQKSLKLLRDANVTVLGVMINALDIKKSDYYYQSYYGTYESYGETPEMG